MTRLTLPGGPPGSTSWVYTDAGDVIVECYDHGEEAAEAFGNDVAFLIRIDASALPHVVQALEVAPVDDASPLATPVARAIAQRFSSYFDVAEWLAKAGIPFERSFDSWA